VVAEPAFLIPSYTEFSIPQEKRSDDGTYRAQLVTRLEKYRDDFALAHQGLLPRMEYQVAAFVIVRAF
jgi:hypothetical protein